MKTGKQYSIKRMMGGRVIEANTDFIDTLSVVCRCINISKYTKIS